MSATETYRDALMSDLQDITQANGFNLTISTVSRIPVRHDEVSKPAVAIDAGEGGASELDSLTNTLGLANQEFLLSLFTQGSTAEADLDSLTDDVRDAVERTTGSIQTAANVEMVAVTRWSEARTEEGVSGQVKTRQAVVEIRYQYTRGNL